MYLLKSVSKNISSKELAETKQMNLINMANDVQRQKADRNDRLKYTNAPPSEQDHLIENNSNNQS
jgi:hypothetical protein